MKELRKEIDNIMDDGYKSQAMLENTLQQKVEHYYLRYNIELDILNGKIKSLREYGDKIKEGVYTFSTNGIEYVRDSQIKSEFKNNKLFSYFIDGTIKNETQGYFIGKRFTVNGKSITYNTENEIIKEEDFKEGKKVTK